MFRRGLVMGKLQVGSGDRKHHEPEYEEVGPPTGLRKNTDNGTKGDGFHCDLCGSAPAAVRCDRCGSQTFCLSCDDMYHRHPRRSSHVRKAVDSKAPSGGGVRPPLPPKGDSQGAPPPQPPPRKNKRSGFGFSKKDQSAASESVSGAGRTIMGSLKKFMGARPLPPTPDQMKAAAKNDSRDAPPSKALIRASTSPSLPNLSDQTNDDIRAGLPQSILELNRSRPPPKNSTSTPATPASPNAQYPPLQPKTQQPHAHTHSLGRKFSLQQLPQAGMEDKRTSLVEPSPGGVGWESEAPKPMPRNRSQSISDDQWAQVMASQGGDGTGGPSGPSCPPGHTPADMSAFVGATTRRGYNTMGGRGSSFGRGMVSSASVCDLNSLAQQQPPHGFNGTHPASSFQQLNMMGYPGGMPMWGAPCDLCTPAHMLASQANASGMKRTASNLSMNLSSVGSDVTGYPWGPPPPHVHHHMPPMFPGYYPGYHPHMGPPAMGSLNMSIPDSMNTFGKVPSSPAPSLRSSSHRSHKSSKSRSFSGADVSGRRSRNRRKQRSEESEESRSSSVSDDDDDDGRNNKVGSSLAWQCDHCTFINSGGVRTCGMCSKTMGSGGGGSGRSSRRGSERHRSDRRRDRRTDHEDDDRDVSDYDNDGGVVKSNLSFNIKDNRRESRTKVSSSNKSKSKKKSRRRGSSASASESASDGEEERLERHMRDLRVSSSSRRRGSDYESVSNKDRDRDRDRDKGSRKREGGSSRFKNRGKSHSERSRTPGRQTPRRGSPVEAAGSRGGSRERSRERSPAEDSRSSHRSPSEDRGDRNSSHEDTVVNTVASEVTAKSEHKSKSDSSKRSRSRARSQAEEVPDEVQVQVEPAPVEQEPLEAKSRTPSPRLQARNSKSPAPSQRDGDEHSFANTLDEITTMGTNEVADQDLSSHYIDERINMQPVEAHDEIPEVIFVRPKTPEEEAVVDRATAAADQLMAVNGEANVAEVQPAAPEPVEKPVSRILPSEPVYEPRYEPIEEPPVNEPPVAAAEPDSEQPDYQTATMGMSAGDKEALGDRDDEQGGDDTLVEATRPMAVADIRGGEGLRSGSSGSSLGINNTPPDRQYTPLSFSSSDAQFYSPPDSPDISLSEQLQDKPLPSNTQTVKAHNDDYLVSALETMQTAQTGDDLKSSRETIRSSFEQLPYSEEAFEGEAEAPARPASAGAAVPPTDGYESLSFKDALTSSEASRKQQQTSLDKADRQSKALEAEVSEKHMTVEQIINKRRQETMERQGLELVQTLRSAEEAGYTTEDVSIALAQSGDKNPLEWLKENWRHMVDTVLTLATNYGHERRVNDVGAITAAEAKAALRTHKGNIWAAVTECVEQRQKKFNDILSRGNFQRQDVVRALETNDGDTDAALQELNKPQQPQPFTMKIWAPPQAPEGQTPKPVSSAHAQVEVQDAPPAPPSPPPPAPPPPAPAPVEPPAAPPAIAGTKQDVVVHPLKAFTHYADLSISEFSEDPHNPDAISPLPHEALPPHPDALAHTPSSPRGAAEARPRAGEAPREVPTSGTHALSESAAPDARPKKNYRKYSSTLHVTLSSRKPEPSPKAPAKPFDSHKSEPDLRFSNAYESISSGQAKQEDPLHPPDSRAPRPESRSAPSSVRNSLLLGDYDESDEEDSVSITTGRLNLSFSSDGVNVKSELVQTEQVAASEHEAALGKGALGDEDEDNTETCVSNPLETDGSLEEGVRTPERSDKKPGEVSRFEEPGMAQTRPGPVTMQKATAIVGKAIAKAMARETSVRESLSRSVTPEIGQDAPMVTPEPSEEEEETVGQAPITDSEDDDHLRTLDTIPEEEEISEMTESGRIISRSASKNLFLPFNPTDVVHLNAVGRGVAAAGTASPRPTPSSTAKAASDEKGGAPSEAGRPASIPERADESVSEAPHNYYNDPKYNYYNAAAGAEDAPAEAPPVKIAPDDYETMYEVKRELDSLRDTSEVTMGKLNALITNEAQDAGDNDDEGIYYEEVVLKSGIDPSSQAKTEAGSEPSTTTPSRRRRRRRRRGRGQGEGGEAGASRADQSEPSAPASSAISSAPPPQAPADTAPPPPETTASASPAEPSPAQAEAEASPSASSPVPPTPAETPAEAATTKAAGGRRRTRLSDSKPYSMIEIVSSKTKEEAADSSQPAEGAASTAAGTYTRRRRPGTAAGADDAGPSSTTNQSSSDYAAATASTTSSTRTRSRARVSESSGDSEDDDRPSRVSEEDPSKIPHLLVQIEGLKARQKKESDYQEVRELKEQIQQMRKQLEAKMEEEGKRPDTPETPKDEHPPPGPLTGPLEAAEEQTKTTSPEEEQLNFDRTVRRLLAEGHAGSYEKAELAAHLMNFSFDEANSLQAAEECSSIYTALQFLQQECELCAEKYPMGKMVSMLQCTHRCCCECAKTYYTFQIKTKNIRDLRCPFCNEPDLDACEEIANEYLNNMDILLKTILDSETHELFQRKLRDWTLMKDPNFRWCNKCSSGFIANPRARKLICPDCKDVTCASCRAPWEASHEGISCEAFARWKNDNDLEAQAQGVAKHLAECGITCPKCKFTYALAKGGCMHFTCTQCKYEFCSGCGQPFRQGSKCPVGPYCERLGLHSHHPRNCLFYLRDKEPHQLQNLLKEAGITYDTEPPETWEPGKSCQVQEQKELPDGLKDDICGRTVPNGYAGLCRLHYTEYLVEKINAHKLDPVSIFDEADLRVCLRRNGKPVPVRRWESEKLYRDKLIKLIKEHLPLDSTV